MLYLELSFSQLLSRHTWTSHSIKPGKNQLQDQALVHIKCLSVILFFKNTASGGADFCDLRQKILALFPGTGCIDNLPSTGPAAICKENYHLDQQCLVFTPQLLQDSQTSGDSVPSPELITRTADGKWGEHCRTYQKNMPIGRTQMNNRQKHPTFADCYFKHLQKNSHVKNIHALCVTVPYDEHLQQSSIEAFSQPTLSNSVFQQCLCCNSPASL